jgi:hypothetical protein
MSSGGRREGAGRKGFAPVTVPVHWRISAEANEWIRGQAAEQGVPVGRIIDELVKTFEYMAR